MYINLRIYIYVCNVRACVLPTCCIRCYQQSQKQRKHRTPPRLQHVVNPGKQNKNWTKWNRTTVTTRITQMQIVILSIITLCSTDWMNDCHLVCFEIVTSRIPCWCRGPCCSCSKHCVCWWLLLLRLVKARTLFSRICTVLLLLLTVVLANRHWSNCLHRPSVSPVFLALCKNEPSAAGSGSTSFSMFD